MTVFVLLRWFLYLLVDKDFQQVCQYCNCYVTDMVPISLKILENWIKLTANTASCRLTWIFYKLVNTAMSFQSFSDLIWQIETYDRLWFTTPARKDY